MLALLGLGSQAHAVDVASSGDVALHVHGFVSQGFIFSTGNNYLAKSKQGSFELHETGINFTAALTDKLRTGVQLFARDLGSIGDYKAVVDWAYLDYHWQDWLGLRAGRVKLPFGLYNDTSDIDAARGVVLLPQSIYPTENRDFLLSQTGVELYGYVDLCGAGFLEYRLNGGTIFLDVDDDGASPITVLDLTIPYVVGGRLMWEPPLEGLRLGGSVQVLRLESDLLFPMDPMVPISVDIPAVLWVASAEYTYRDLQLALEYSRWHVEVESSDPMRFPESSSVSERAYAMLSYRVSRRFQPSIYYSLYYPDVDDRSGRESQQHDVAISARFDPSSYWIIKLEAHFAHGTAGLEEELNDNVPLEELDENWGVFLVKTTAYF